MQRLDFDEDSRYWIGIAVREALANAIKHGNRQDPSKQVEIDLTVEAEELVVCIRDQGSGFDPERVPDPLDPDNLLKPDGRGIFYMERFMDRIEYHFGPQGGTEVTLRKRIGAARPEPGVEEEGQRK